MLAAPEPAAIPAAPNPNRVNEMAIIKTKIDILIIVNII